MGTEIKLSEELINSKSKIDETEEKTDRNKEFNEVIYKIVEHLTNVKTKLITDIREGKESFSKLEAAIIDYIDDHTLFVKGYNRKNLIKGVKDWLFYNWTYQDILDDHNTTEIKIVDRDLTIINKVNKNGAIMEPIFDRTEHFSSEDAYLSFCKYLARRNQKELNKINSILNFTDKNTCKDAILRINITSEFLNSRGVPLIVIAKTPRHKYTLDELEELDMFDSNIKQYLITGAKAGLKIIFGGAGGAGKTNILNAVIEEIPDDVPTLVLQRDAELHSEKFNIFFQEILEDVMNGHDFSLRRLSLNAMKMRVKQFIIGELEGAETFDFFNAAYSGHKAIATIHIDSPEEFVPKAIQYIQYANAYLSEEILMRMLSSMDVVYFMKDFKVNKVSEISGYNFEKKEIIYNTVFEYDSNKNKFIRVNDSCKKIKEKIAYYYNRRNILRSVSNE